MSCKYKYITVVSKDTEVLTITSDMVSAKYGVNRYIVSKDDEAYSITTGNVLYTNFSYALMNKYNEIIIDSLCEDRLVNFLEFLLKNGYNIKIDVSDLKD